MGLGDDVIFWVPGIPVFVDSRLESYPPDFLRAVMAAQSDDAVLAELIDRFDAQWVFAQPRAPAACARASSPCCAPAGSRSTSTAPTSSSCVRRRADRRPTCAQHAIDLRRAQPGDLVAAPALRRQQEEDFAAFIAALGPGDPAPVERRP